MSITPLRQAREGHGLRVLPGRRRRAPSTAPWMIMVVITVIGFLGLGFARTSLDRSAFELAELNRSIAEQEALNQELRLEVAQLENPARIAPLADELGLVIPSQTRPLFVDLDTPSPVLARVSSEGANQ